MMLSNAFSDQWADRKRQIRLPSTCEVLRLSLIVNDSRRFFLLRTTSSLTAPLSTFRHETRFSVGLVPAGTQLTGYKMS
jgi:hypothetical protein